MQGRAGNPVLKVGRAFVVHFRDDADPAARRFQGRVEHVASGEAMRFRSLAELVTFMGRRVSATRELTSSPGPVSTARRPRPGNPPGTRRSAGGERPRRP